MSATPKPWYDLDPKRLQWELDEFERHALRVELSTDSKGRLLVAVSGVRFRGQPAPITVTFPHDYPFFPPEVVGSELLLDRHQGQVGLNYCLLEDPQRDWHPGRSAGRLVGKNLRNLLKDSAAGQKAIRAGEARMAEPESAFFASNDVAVVLVAEPFLSNELLAASGAMTIRSSAGRLRLLVEAGGHARIEDELLERYPSAAADITGRWVSLWTRPSADDYPQGLLQSIVEVDPSIVTRLEKRLKKAPALPESSSVVGVTFLEQGPTRDEQRRNWLFVEVVKKRGMHPTLRRWPADTQALSAIERARRLPELIGLERLHIAVVGAGSVGAPVAVELTKAGVGDIAIIDGDRYDANNTVRHVLGDQHAGDSKAEALEAYCRQLNPFSRVVGHWGIRPRRDRTLRRCLIGRRSSSMRREL